MNFLAHLHLAYLAKSSLLGNLLADFVRGDPKNDYAPEIASGIMLHRRIDALVDGLEQIKICRSYFNDSYRRVAPITLDIVWDHFLALHWAKLESQYSLVHFSNLAYSKITPYLPNTPAPFQQMNQYLWSQRWLERYAELPFIANVLKNMARQRPRLQALAGSFSEIERHYPQFEAQFWQFYPQLVLMAKTQTL